MVPTTRGVSFLPVAVIGVVLLRLTTAEPAAQTGYSFRPAFDAFLRGELTASLMPEIPKGRKAVADIKSLITRDSALWIAEGPPAERDKRRLIAASISLYLANSLASGTWQGSWLRGIELMEWGCALVRRNAAPTEAERLWHWAAIALTQASGDGNAAEHHSNHASDRFPDEPRFALARAVALELRSFPDDRHRTLRDRNGTLADRLIERFRNAAKYPETRAEARIRLGFVMLRLKLAGAALDTLRESGEVKEPHLRYLHGLFEGRAYDQAGKPDEAVAAYRRALAAVPRAQTAELALASALARSGRQADALRVMETALAPVASPPPDPWLLYGQGDSRFWPAIARALEAALK
jgi:tetratricopeptide (TPR) repeat protein